MADQSSDIEARARALDRWLDERGVLQLASYGVANAVLELWLHRLRPDLELTVTDYAPETVALLRSHFEGARVEHHDLLRDPPVDAELHLFHRIDTEFSDREWQRILARFARRRVLVIVGGILPVWRALRAMVSPPAPNVTHAGTARTRGAFEALWKHRHKASALRFHDLHAWELESRSS